MPVGPEENSRKSPGTMAGSVRLSFRREGFLLVVAFTASVVIALGNTGKCWLHEIPWRFYKVTKHFPKETTTKPNTTTKIPESG